MVAKVLCGVEFDDVHDICLNVVRAGMEKSEAKFFTETSSLENSSLIWDSASSIAMAHCVAWQRHAEKTTIS
jgi:hypothetical protein